MTLPLWSPSESFKQNSNLNRYREWLRDNRGLLFPGYEDLWRWSTDNSEAFWSSLVDYFDVWYDGEPTPVMRGNEMPEIRWFGNMRLNYAEHIFRNSAHDRPAIIFQSETGSRQEISWAALTDQVAALRQYLQSLGVTRGDRVVAFLPSIPEATVAFLAVNTLGAVWSSCSPDFGAGSVVDRFAQIEPRVLIAVDGYHYGGKFYDKAAVLREIVAAIPSLEKIIVVKSSEGVSRIADDSRVATWHDATKASGVPLMFERVPFGHPIWVLYSSGTTGLPKAITHSHGGILLEQLKYGSFHNNFKAGERCFWYTTTGWMMWNYIQGCLLAGGTLVLYDGSPGYPDLNVLWKFTAEAQLHHFGTSAGFIMACRKAGIHPGAAYDLSQLISLSSTGSTLPPEGFEWAYKEVKEDLWLASMSGGTDVCSAFVGGNPMAPVFSGEIQCRALGCKLEAFDERGKPVVNEVGEMVITAPMPSMPVYFWNDPGHTRYRESYFEHYPGVWRHGDWIEINDRGGITIFGRSDATLNRGGVRIGTSEVYRAVDTIAEVQDSLVVCVERPGGEFWMPLFVLMKENRELTEPVREKIRSALKTQYSPRHVPDEIIQVSDIPYTISGKKTETPVKKILAGMDPEKVVNAGALRNPESMDFFIEIAREKGEGLKG